MATIASSLTASILTLSIGLHFGVILALCGLLVLAGTAGQWSLARIWFPVLFEPTGIVLVLVGLAAERPEVTAAGLGLVLMGRLAGRRSVAATLNASVESWMLGSALVSVCAVAATRFPIV